MKRAVLSSAVVLASLPSLAFADETCTAATLQGQYVFTGRGFIEAVQPGVQRVHYGVLKFAGKGNLSGKQSSSRGGKVGREKLQGTYVLDSDCSGSLKFSSILKPGSFTQWDLYVSPDGRKGNIIRMDEGNMAVRSFEK